MRLQPAPERRRALRLVWLFGIISLLADATYEGARAITGPFLAVLGASGAVVGIVSGAGELVGYLIRLASGYWTDRIRRYWALLGLGYALNLGAVPLLALVGRWEWAVLLLLLERLGKGLRTPPRDVVLSYAAARLGGGRVFGLHEALDQIGAVGGPLFVAAILGVRESYALAFAALALPAMGALVVLAYTHRRYPHPERLEGNPVPEARSERFPAVFGWYLAASAALAMGYADFPLIGYHAERIGVLSGQEVAALYALAMGVDALAALLFGRLFDRLGLWALIIALLMSAGFAPLAFAGRPEAIVAGAVLWGVGMGAQESVLRAEIARLLPPEWRGRAYGIFHAVFGLAWFVGSLAMGLLYERDLQLLVIWSVGFLVLATGLMGVTMRTNK
jgi:MFS family permease